MNTHVVFQINSLSENRIANFTLVILLARMQFFMRPQAWVAWKFSTTNIAAKWLVVERLRRLISGWCMVLNGMMLRCEWRRRWRLIDRLNLNLLNLLRWCTRWGSWINYLCTCSCIRGRSWSGVVFRAIDNHNPSPIACCTLGDGR